LLAPRSARRLIALLTDEDDRLHRNDRRSAALVEAAVALRLVRSGCRVAFEVPLRNGRTADFDVRSGDLRFLLHVKRWAAERDDAETTLRIPAAIRALEDVRRPLLVGARWPALRRLVGRYVEEGTRFLATASVGDAWVFRDDDGLPSGGLRVLAPCEGDRTTLTVGLDAAEDSDHPRLVRLLRKAYAQFDPRATNVILLCGGAARDARIVDTAILGSHIERWDLFPPRGQRIAHGRADDGFWAGERAPHARAVAWCPWSDTKGLGTARLWFRSRVDIDGALRDALGAV
jgi:hypothetical protein